MILYRAYDLSPTKIAASYITRGYIALAVCDSADPNDSNLIDEMIIAYNNKRPARLKGQRFIVGEINIFPFSGAIHFGLQPCPAGAPTKKIYQVSEI